VKTTIKGDEGFKAAKVEGYRALVGGTAMVFLEVVMPWDPTLKTLLTSAEARLLGRALCEHADRAEGKTENALQVARAGARSIGDEG
jgi:hypothetical protein